jgi:hypothetical protein
MGESEGAGLTLAQAEVSYQSSPVWRRCELLGDLHEPWTPLLATLLIAPAAWVAFMLAQIGYSVRTSR